MLICLGKNVPARPFFQLKYQFEKNSGYPGLPLPAPDVVQAVTVCKVEQVTIQEHECMYTVRKSKSERLSILQNDVNSLAPQIPIIQTKCILEDAEKYSLIDIYHFQVSHIEFKISIVRLITKKSINKSLLFFQFGTYQGNKLMTLIYTNRPVIHTLLQCFYMYFI